MCKKVVALGNRLLLDDGIGLYVLEYLEKEIMDLGFEVFYGETDPYYCLNIINTNDFVIFMDAVSLGQNPGKVVSLSISEINKLMHSHSQHDLSIFTLLDFYHINFYCSLIGIEVHTVEMGLGLSSILNQQFPKICDDVFKEIIEKSV